jgi:hypothetical protein
MRCCSHMLAAKLRTQLACVAIVCGASVALASCDDELEVPGCTPGALDYAECGRALDELCRSQHNEPSCVAQGPFDFDDTLLYGCSWASRVVLSELASCTVGEADHVCVALVFGSESISVDDCEDPCVEGPAGSRGVKASTTRDELLKLSCFQGRAVGGPLDESIALDDPTYSYLSCSPDTAPEAPQELCACVPQACAAMAALDGG